MNPKVQVIAVIGAVLIAGLVLELVRKRRLREEYSLVWLCAIICLGVLVCDRPLVEKLAGLLGIAYAPAALFVAGFAVVFLLLLNFSVAISRLDGAQQAPHSGDWAAHDPARGNAIGCRG